jgi:hypothetical protein
MYQIPSRPHSMRHNVQCVLSRDTVPQFIILLFLLAFFLTSIFPLLVIITAQLSFLYRFSPFIKDICSSYR